MVVRHEMFSIGSKNFHYRNFEVVQLLISKKFFLLLTKVGE